METTADTNQPASESLHCNQVFDTDLLQKFASFYNRAAEPHTFETLAKLKDIQMFDCDYMYVIEIRPKLGVFGIGEAFIFQRPSFAFLGSPMIE